MLSKNSSLSFESIAFLTELAEKSNIPTSRRLLLFLSSVEGGIGNSQISEVHAFRMEPEHLFF